MLLQTKNENEPINVLLGTNELISVSGKPKNKNKWECHECGRTHICNSNHFRAEVGRTFVRNKDPEKQVKEISSEILNFHH